MAKILFLAHRVPFPPDKGDKIRAYNLLLGLAARHEVWLGAGADEAADLAHLPAARAICRDVCFAPLAAARRGLNLAGGLASGAPLSVSRFHHPDLARWTGKVLDEVKPDIVFVYSSAMAQYVLGRLPRGARLVVDFVDADAEKWRAYARTGPVAMRPVYWREFRRLVGFETRVLSAADLGIVVTETERRLLADLQPAGADKLHVVPNGVDTDYFAASRGAGEGEAIVFCGRMDYLPNIDAAQWFAREVLPLVRRRAPGAVFRIVGAAPTPTVWALAELPGVEVTGTVADVRPYLEQARVVVAPLRIARGVQNKVLEGMSAARPVVATPEALDGLGAVPGRDLLVGSGTERFADQVLAVLHGHAPAGIGAAARAYVQRHHRWGAQVEALERLLGGEPAVSAEAAA